MHQKICFSQALTGFELTANSRGLSKNTIKDYFGTYYKFLDFLEDDKPIEDITKKDVETFLSIQTVGNKTKLNYHIGLSALWTWCVEMEIVEKNMIRSIARPKAPKKDIIPYTHDDIKALLNACDYSRAYSRPGKKICQNKILHSHRNKTIMILMLDTGIRLSELSDLKIADVELTNQRLVVERGKGDKERVVPFSSRTGKNIWKYLATRKSDNMKEALFSTKTNRHILPGNIHDFIERAGDRAGVRHAHPHRFRHTFAIEYLRNGGDIFSLQRILGHSTLDMVKRYLSIAQADIESAHRRASPVDNWMLT
ncbi:MAG: tyrosine-type recombinase/integrase [Anaerolineaceae bacterium]|nr:tyrosine-type recombinase/integrase [Anaerolineaceae bacterium]